MIITVHYYAMLREQAGRSTEQRTTSAITPGDLYAELARVHRFAMPVDNLRVAVNDAFTSMDHPLHDRDTVTFIPPVAGG
jgi:molybdopterin synthase sulfur carrier subunit